MLGSKSHSLTVLQAGLKGSRILAQHILFLNSFFRHGGVKIHILMYATFPDGKFLEKVLH